MYICIMLKIYVMFVMYICPDNTTDTHVFQWLLKELSTEKNQIYPPPCFDADQVKEI